MTHEIVLGWRSAIPVYNQRTVTINVYTTLLRNFRGRIKAKARGMTKRNDRAIYHRDQTHWTAAFCYHMAPGDTQGLLKVFVGRRSNFNPFS